MPWINPLDRVPQIPQDWANHIAQGGLWSMLIIYLLSAFGLSIQASTLLAFMAMVTVSVLKKIVDYFKEGESFEVCAGKAVVTVLWPASLALVAWTS